MRHRWQVLLVALVLLTAGCLTAGEEIDPASEPDADGTRENGTETNDTDSSSGRDEQPSSNETDEEDGSEEDESGESSEDQDEDAGDDSENETDEEQQPSSWPDVDNATIRPGVQILHDGQCTSNFLFRTPDNTTLMLGTAAHCFAGNPNAGGCSDDADPVAPGAEVEIEGASQPGVLVYSSWYSMEQLEDPSDSACNGNDFALVAIDPADRSNVHPAVQGFGGPTGLASSDGIGTGDRIEWYGNSGSTPESQATSEHEGSVIVSLDWRFQAYSAAPGVPGDSGSGAMLENGRAAGVLTTVQFVYPGANGFAKLDRALSFAEEAGTNAELVTWPQFDEALT